MYVTWLTDGNAIAILTERPRALETTKSPMTSFITTMFVFSPFLRNAPRPLPVIATNISPKTFRPSPSTSSISSLLTTALLPYCDEATDLKRGLQEFETRNARTRGQFRPKNANKGTSTYQLRQFAEATLGSGSLRKAVQLPEGEDLNEWLAVNGTTSHGKHAKPFS